MSVLRQSFEAGMLNAYKLAGAAPVVRGSKLLGGNSPPPSIPQPPGMYGDRRDSNGWTTNAHSLSYNSATSDPSPSRGRQDRPEATASTAFSNFNRITQPADEWGNANMQRTETDVRGPLTIRTSTEDFRDFYWLKVELLEFCRKNDLSTVGGKREIADRIEHFLRTGERLAPAPPSRGQPRPQGSELTMDTQAPAGFRCTQEVRAFFVSHLGPDFRFTVPLQRFIQEHPGVTLGEVAKEWERQKEARRTGTLRPEIAPQFQYNQFTHDFYADPRNQGRSRQECQEAWLRTRERRGDKKYHPDEG